MVCTHHCGPNPGVLQPVSFQHLDMGFSAICLPHKVCSFIAYCNQNYQLTFDLIAKVSRLLSFRWPNLQCQINFFDLESR